MALTFDTHEAIRKLRGKGHDEAQAEGVVEFVRDATGELVTTDYLNARFHASEGRIRSELYRAVGYRPLAVGSPCRRPGHQASSIVSYNSGTL